MPPRVKNKIHVQIGQRIKQIRTQSGYSQEDLANELGVDQVILSNMENGKRPPTVDEVIAICQLFNVNFDYLLLGKVTSKLKAGREIQELARQITEKARGIK